MRYQQLGMSVVLPSKCAYIGSVFFRRRCITPIRGAGKDQYTSSPWARDARVDELPTEGLREYNQTIQSVVYIFLISVIRCVYQRIRAYTCIANAGVHYRSCSARRCVNRCDSRVSIPTLLTPDHLTRQKNHMDAEWGDDGHHTRASQNRQAEPM
jgi:hypothetical protein